MPQRPGPPVRDPYGSHPWWEPDESARLPVPGNRLPRDAGWAGDPGPRTRDARSGRPDGSGTRWSPARRHRLRRTVLTLTAGLASITLIGGLFVYQHLNGNLRSDPLFAGLTGNAGTEKADPFGHTPLNILLIGSDTRSTAADCHLGGGCANGGRGANADVEMVVHVAADRSNATVMSIPRDTVTLLPACRTPKGAQVPPRTAQINSSLAYGPGCTVAAVHQLTGIPIDHFVMVDFSGVIAMSDAVGGASVCVTNSVYDPYSHLKLTKGRHTLKGLGALEFVRSRHAFGDGSDLGRTYAQHLFLSAVIRNLKSAGTLTRPTTLYSLADAATKALTVDTGLADIPRLLALAVDLDKVPTDRITFTTMPNLTDPANRDRVVPAPSAQGLFDAIAADRALTKTKATGTASSAATAEATPTVGAAIPAATVRASRVSVHVENGSGLTGRAATVSTTLIGQGFNPRTHYSAAPADAANTMLTYGPGEQPAANTVAQALHLPASTLRQGSRAGLVLVIGRDWTAGTVYPATASTPAPVTSSALQAAHAQTADRSGTCAPVGNQATVVVNGIAMSPDQAFRYSQGVPLSAP
jgi:LCP family protein required for cell wall assembly